MTVSRGSAPLFPHSLNPLFPPRLSGCGGFLDFGDAHGLPRTFARAGVRARALAANRQTATVADAAVTVDRLQSFQVGGNFTAKIALEHPFVLGDQVQDLVELFF